MKYILFLLFMPCLVAGQTVHIENDKIVYKGIVKLDGVTKEELTARAKQAILNNVSKKIEEAGVDKDEKQKIISNGRIKLASPYHLIKTVEYMIEIGVSDGSYEYRIDSVYMKVKERAGKTNKISSEELLSGMDITGEVSAITEKQLNEIDMVIQKLLALIMADTKKTHTAEK